MTKLSPVPYGAAVAGCRSVVAGNGAVSGASGIVIISRWTTRYFQQAAIGDLAAGAVIHHQRGPGADGRRLAIAVLILLTPP